MQANETTFQRMVEGTKQFQVPLYQRPYSWGQEELERLWGDVTEQAERDQETRPGGSAGHFLGSVVLAPGPFSASTLTRWLVIDGQQRLTSLSIMLAALRDRLREVEELEEGDHSGADRINDVYLLNKYKKGLDKYRLLPTQADRAAYTAIVNERPDAGGKDRMGFAYNFFSGEIHHCSEEELLRIEETIGHRLSLVDIQAEAGDNVFRIFESLNNTGKGLIQTDLLRNYVFMLLPETGQEVYDEIWLPMQEELGPETLETLAWLDLVLRGDERAKQSEVYHGQKERLEKVSRDGGENALRAEVEHLWRLGQLLQRVLDPAFEDDPELAEVLTRLNAWGNTIYRPLALHLMVLRDQGHTNTDDLVRALGYVESFLVRRMIAGVTTQGLNRIFTSSPKEIQLGGSVADSVHRYLSDPRRWPPTDPARGRDAPQLLLVGRALQRTFVLRRLRRPSTPEPVDFGKAVSIEHIMPRNLTEEWYEILNKQTDRRDRERTARASTAHPGQPDPPPRTQTVQPQFERKQKIFQSSGLSMNRHIADAPVGARRSRRGRPARRPCLCAVARPDVFGELEPAPRGRSPADRHGARRRVPGPRTANSPYWWARRPTRCPNTWTRPPAWCTGNGSSRTPKPPKTPERTMPGSFRPRHWRSWWGWKWTSSSNGSGASTDSWWKTNGPMSCGRLRHSSTPGPRPMVG